MDALDLGRTYSLESYLDRDKAPYWAAAIAIWDEVHTILRHPGWEAI